MKMIDMTGRRFGRLTVLEQAGELNEQAAWRCRCDCGKETIVHGQFLRNGNTASCGCLRLGADLTGKRFGRLVVIKKVPIQFKGRTRWHWLCKCDCGKTAKPRTEALLSGITKSCGCYATEINTKHGTFSGGKKHDRLYNIWANMLYRCRNKNCSGYKNYGGRGITVCKEWYSFPPFHEWAVSHGYADNLSIDRMDNNGNYCPENCRWADTLTQCNNTRANRYLTVDGITRTYVEWERIMGYKKTIINQRIERGWTPKEAVYGKETKCQQSTSG
jgi:hypothetical protein